MKNIFEFDWFSNRDNLGKYKFDKSNAIYDFSKNSISKLLFGNKISHLVTKPRNIERELEELNSFINKDKYIKVILNNSSEDEYYTNGEQIVLSSKPIIEFGENGLDILVGALVHEASHIRWSDFNIENKKYANNKTVHWIWNILEDEVIEQMTQIEKPGLGNSLAPIKDYLFKSEKAEGIDDIDFILYALFAIIRYPQNLRNLDPIWLKNHKYLFEAIYKILKANNVLNIQIKQNASQENYKSAVEIFKLISRDTPESEFEKKFGENGEPGESITSDIKSTKIGQSLIEAQNESHKKDIQNKANKFDPISEEKLKSQISKSSQKESKTTTPCRGSQPCQFLDKKHWVSTNNINKYNELKQEINKYIKYIQNIQLQSNSNKTIYQKVDFQRNGSLMGRTLANAYIGDKSVYSKIESKIGREKHNKFALVLTLDESGSMRYFDDMVSQLAIMFVEAFKSNSDIEIYIYGHSDYIVEYLNPQIKDYIILAERFKGGGQNEPLAYNSIIKDVLSKTNSEILLVNITDSQYLGDYKEIEKILREYNKNISQSLIVVNNELNSDDINCNNKIYGKNQWAHIPTLDNQLQVTQEISKMVKYINKLSKNVTRNRK